MILVDSNVPMYLVGAADSHRIAARRALEDYVARRERLVTDAEVLQEILHHYVAIKRPEAIQPALDAVLDIVDDVFEITRDDVLRARDIVHGSSRLSARDALHLAVMERRGVSQILSFDTAFDDHPGVTRLA